MSQVSSFLQLKYIITYRRSIYTYKLYNKLINKHVTRIYIFAYVFIESSPLY